MRKVYLAIILMIAVISIGVFFYFNMKKETTKSKILLMPESGLIKNPNIIYNDLYMGASLSSKTDWKSNGFYYNHSYMHRNGAVMLYPINLSVGRYIEQEVYLSPQKKYNLLVSVADVGGETHTGITICPNIKISSACSSNGLIFDVGFKIKVIEADTKVEHVIDDLIANSTEGWKDLSYDISNYAGKNIIVRVESYAGGPCDIWNGEWAAVDYLTIAEK